MIIAFSGKKQSGKTSMCNFLFGNALTHIILPGGDPLISYYKIDNKGGLVVPALADPPMVWDGDKNDWVESTNGYSEANFDPLSSDLKVREFLFHNVWEHVKVYNFADTLKERVLIGLLGLSRESVYGTNEQKNLATHLAWEDMPVPRHVAEDESYLLDFLTQSGALSGREVAQFVGTQIFRKMYPSTWINACLQQIKQEDSAVAIIGDVRFPDEVEAIQNAGGKVVRLLRNVVEDSDESETALDDYDGFDVVVDNNELTLHETYLSVMEELKKLDQ